MVLAGKPGRWDCSTTAFRHSAWGGADTVAEGVGRIKKSNNAETLMDINDQTAPPCEVQKRVVQMNPDRSRDIAARLMSEFARRTGLSPAAPHKRRYLWTDAFAVCNFLELFRQTEDQSYRRNATELIDQVHLVLGQYRDDDVRRGWISGLDDESGRGHPTRGGLRIGKALRERGRDEAFDERLEWDRDGQYFHYLTKWMHALCRAAFLTGNSNYVRWAVELALKSFSAFARRSASGDVVGVYWKMSTDLSRPLVPAVGLHDALDGYITFLEVRHALATTRDHREGDDLAPAIETLSALCQHKDWATDDPLGLGGLLFDAGRLCQLIGDDNPQDIRLLEAVLQACRHGLAALLASRYLDRPTAHRLAFRELGLAIGLSALPIITDAINDSSRFGDSPLLRRIIESLLPYESLREHIIGVWLPQPNHRDESWRAHEDINDVMLATAVIPNMVLSVGDGIRTDAR